MAACLHLPACALPPPPFPFPLPITTHPTPPHTPHPTPPTPHAPTPPHPTHTAHPTPPQARLALNPSAAASALVALKAAYPGADLAAVVGGQPGLLLQGPEQLAANAAQVGGGWRTGGGG
jgi:hypothetical protein